METRGIVEGFVDAINSGRAEKVVERMRADAVFVDSLGGRLEGRAVLLDGWRGYYRMFPDYRIQVDGIFVDEAEAMLHGRAGATLHRNAIAAADGRWEIPAAWRAIVDGRRIALWQVYADNKPVHDLLAK